MKTTIKNRRLLLGLIQVIAWGIFLFFPILMEWGSTNIDLKEYIRRLPIPLSFMAVFYINYFFLIDTCLFREKVKKFVLINLLIIVVICGALHIKNELNRKADKAKIELKEKNTTTFSKKDKKLPMDYPHPPYEFKKKMEEERLFHWRIVIIFIFRDVLSLMLTVGLAVAIKMTGRWYEAEASRRELEKSKTEAELKNLKNQLNPHFLLNTLNNIYALIAFDSDKAQQAVQDLSKLLRYVLYDNQQNVVLLTKEAEFISNYIELMRIRLTDHIRVETSISLKKGSNTLIAPLIFISLIENAFKHGISSTEPSFIEISLTENEDGQVMCKISNSYHPKTDMDKSGSGIGLEQVRKRLELLYPGRYIWHKGVSDDGKTYESLLVINTNNNEKNLS